MFGKRARLFLVDDESAKEVFIRYGRNEVFVGDSGERDPEIDGALARKFPDQIIRIYTGDVTKVSADSNRYQKAFCELPGARWQLFCQPSEISVAP